MDILLCTSSHKHNLCVNRQLLMASGPGGQRPEQGSLQLATTDSKHPPQQHHRIEKDQMKDYCHLDTIQFGSVEARSN